MVDEWIKTEDNDSFKYARQLIREEAILIGGSSGSCYSGALKFLTQSEIGKKISKDPSKTVVLIFADSLSYFSILLNNANINIIHILELEIT